MDNYNRSTRCIKKLKKRHKNSFLKNADLSDINLKYLWLWLEKAKNLLKSSKSGDFKEATLYYESIININRVGVEENSLNDNEMAKVYSDMSYALLNIGKYQEACEAIEKSLELKPEYNNEALNNKGLILYKQEKFKEALDTFEEVLKNSNDQDTYTLYYKGLVLIKTNEYKKARETFEKVISLKKQKCLEALIGKGIAYRRMGQFEDSLKSIKEVLESSKDTNIEYVEADARYQIGLTLTEMSEYKDALDAFEMANSRKKQKFPEALIGKGVAYRRMGQFEDSLKSIEEVLNSDRTHANAWYQNGLTYIEMSEYKNALDAFEMANDLKKQRYPEALIEKGIIYFKMEQFEKSLKSIEEALKSSDYISDSDWYQIGLTFIKLDRYKEALEAFDKVILIARENELYDKEIKTFKKLLDIQYDQALLYTIGLDLREKARNLSKKKDEIITLETLLNMLFTSCLYLNKIAELDPENYKVHYDIGLAYRYAYVIYKEYNKNSEAIEALKRTLMFYNKAIEINPNYPEAWYDKGVSLFDLKKYRESLNSLDKAASLDYNYSMAWYYKGLAYNQIKEYNEALKAFDTALSIKDKKENRDKAEEQNIFLNKGLSYYGLKDYENSLNLLKEVKDSEQEPKALNDIGLIYYSRKEYKEALQFFDEAIQKKGITYAWNNKGLTLGKCGKFTEAIECFNKALDNECQKDIYALYYKGLSNFNLKKYKEAIECFDDAIKYDNPTDLRYLGALTNKAFALQNLGKYNLARKYFKKTVKTCDNAISLNPKHIDAWNNKAIASRELREFDLSNKAFQEALILYDNKLENDPEDIDALCEKGVIYHNLKDYTKALDSFDKAININQKYGLAWYYKGIALYNLTHYCKAVEAFDRSIKCFEDIENKVGIRNAIYNKALAYCKLKEYDEAEKIFSEYLPSIDLSPKNESSLLTMKFDSDDIYYERGLFNIGLEDYKNALICFKKVVDSNKNNLLAWYYKGIAHYNLDRPFEAITAFDKVLELNPDFPDVWYQKGIALFNCRKYLEAIKAFDESIRLKPDSPDSWYRKGLCFTSINSSIEAVKSFEKSIQIYNDQLEKNPEYLNGWYYKGLILFDIGKFEEARLSFKNFLQILDEVENDSSKPKLLEQKEIALFYLMGYEELMNKLKKDMIPNSFNSFLSKYVDAASNIYRVFNKDNQINHQKPTTCNSESITLRERESLLNKQIFFYHNQGEYDKALKICDLASDCLPKDKVLNNKGTILFSCKSYTDAIWSFKKAAKFDNSKNKSKNKNPEIWNNLGRALYEKGKYTEAINSFDKAIEINPLYPEAWSNKGLVLLELKEYDRSLETLENAIKVYPNNVLAYIYLGNLFLTLGDFDTAIKKVDDARRICVNDNITMGQLWCLKGQAQIGKSMYEDAADSFEKAISYYPVNPFLILWKSYARYLNNELYFKSKKEKATDHYNDNILSIIRDLEKTLNYFERVAEKSVLHSSYSSRGNLFENSKSVDDLKVAKAYTLYFLGCLYYKINDVFTAHQKLNECKKLNTKPAVQKSAHTLKDNIWNYQIMPSLSWRTYWLHSPNNIWINRLIFGLLVWLIFDLLELRDFLSKGFSSYFTSEENQGTYPVLIQFSLLVLILFFALLSPSIKSIKGKDIEFEMQHSTPPPFELYLCMPPFKYEGTNYSQKIESSLRIYSAPIDKITGQWKSMDEMK